MKVEKPSITPSFPIIPMAPVVFSAEGLQKKHGALNEGPRAEDCFLIDIQLFIHHLTVNDLTFLVGETFDGHAAMVGCSLEALQRNALSGNLLRFFYCDTCSCRRFHRKDRYRQVASLIFN